METNNSQKLLQPQTTMIFSQNNHFAFIYKKTERLVTALYMITNFIKDNEPLKWKLREEALALLSLNMSFNTVSLSDRKDLLRKYQAMSIEIISISSIAYHSGLISEMNFEILKKEFNNLVSIITKDENKKSNEETVILDKNFFAETEESKLINNTINTNINNNVFYKKTPDTSNNIDNNYSNETKESVKTNPFKKESVIKDNVIKDSSNNDIKNKRRELILNMLSKKSGLNVKDFLDTIKGVGAKTIQRELLSMVSSGILKKEGERRWSTYSLAKNQ